MTEKDSRDRTVLIVEDAENARRRENTRQPWMERVPIIAVTAHPETDFREGAKAAGFEAYVTKPIDMDWLSELIKGLLI